MSSMKKSVCIAFLAILIACTATQTTEEPRPVDFRTGTEGLRMNFVPNLPPFEMLDQQTYQAMIQVENKGTWPLGPDDTVYISGFDPGIIQADQGKNIPPLEGRGPFLPQGGINTVTFNLNIPDIGAKRVDRYDPTILATACYDYTTIASAQVCLDPNPYAPTSIQKVCQPTSVATGSQGAPIAITNVDVQASPGITRFRIDIANVGGGDVFKEELKSKCSPYKEGFRFDEIDYVTLSDIGVSDSDIMSSCKPLDTRTGNIRLTDGRATLYCETSFFASNNAYLTPLTIQLSYGYRQSIAHRVSIRPTSPIR